MKRRILNAVAALAFGGAGMFSAQAETNFIDFSFSFTNTIPDGAASGLANHQVISGLDGTIADINVTLNLSGDFNGDLYVYLVHEDVLVTLLNRLGRTSDNPFGYAGSGLSLTLDDQASHDIHWYETGSPTFSISGQLVGSWQADGRNLDPESVDENSPRTTSLSLFNGGSPNGTWTLFAADLSNGGDNVLLSWGVEITTVPEPAPAALLVAAGFSFFYYRGRIRRNRCR